MNKLISIILFSICFASCDSITISGFQDKISYSPDETISVFLNSNANGEIKIALNDINDKIIDKVNVEVFKQKQIDTSSWFKDGFQYKKTFSFSPKELSSGIYYFHNSSPFLIKNPKKKNDVLVVYPSNTINAYNQSGGRSGYSKPRAKILNFKRPADLDYFAQEFLKWIPSQEFNVDYICDRDLDDYTNIENYKVIVIPGHNEYWTRKARLNFDKYINKGGNAMVLSGNTMWWQVRYEDDKMIIFRDINLDSLAPDSLKTILWNDSLLNYPIASSIGVDFDYGGYGKKEDEGWDGYKILLNSPLLEKTKLKKGDLLKLPTTEYDGTKLIFENKIPKLDTSVINFYRQELIGYDFGFRAFKTTPSFIVFKKMKTSGIIINTASTDWCGNGFIHSSSKEIKQITYNCIDFLINDKNVFSETE